MSKKGILIFSGFNMRAVIAFIRTLESNNLDYGIIASSKEDDIFFTVYKKKVYAVRTTLALDISDINDCIDKIDNKLNCDYYLLAPSSEALNRFVLNNIIFFEQKKCFFPTVGKKLYESISDKYSFGEMCSNFKIQVPKTYGLIKDHMLPIVAKPRQYYSRDNKVYSPIIIRTKGNLEQFFQKHSLNDFYFQEYVEGRCLYLLYYFFKDGLIDKYSQENFLQQEDGKSILVAKSSSFHTSKASKKFEQLFQNLKFRGLVMVELKVNDNNFIMIEANPRFWGPSQLFVDAGINLFESLLIDYGVLNYKKNRGEEKEVHYFWNDGVLKNIKTRPKLAFHNYSSKIFLNELEQLKQIEVYGRNDILKYKPKGKNANYR